MLPKSSYLALATRLSVCVPVSVCLSHACHVCSALRYRTLIVPTHFFMFSQKKPGRRKRLLGLLGKRQTCLKLEKHTLNIFKKSGYREREILLAWIKLGGRALGKKERKKISRFSVDLWIHFSHAQRCWLLAGCVHIFLGVALPVVVLFQPDEWCLLATLSVFQLRLECYLLTSQVIIIPELRNSEVSLAEIVTWFLGGHYSHGN